MIEIEQKLIFRASHMVEYGRGHCYRVNLFSYLYSLQRHADRACFGRYARKPVVGISDQVRHKSTATVLGEE